MTEHILDNCCVCKKDVTKGCPVNQSVLLPVCDDCRDTKEEAEVVKSLLEGMADGFVCGCI